MVTTANDNRVEIAVSYGRNHIPVHPCCAPIGDGKKCSASWHTHGPDYVGKIPLIDGWQDKAIVDEAQIRDLWTKYPGANIGTPTNGLIVLDVDPRNGGAESIAKIEARYGPLTLTLTNGTGTDGEHIIYRNASGLDIRNAQPLSDEYPGIDVRANGGQIIMPGSLSRTGKQYYVKQELPIEDAPEWLVNLIIEKARGNGHHTTGAPIVKEQIPRGSHDAWLTSMAGTYRARGDSAEIIADKLMLDFARLENQDPAHPYTREDALRIAHSIGKKPAGAPKKPEPTPKPEPKTWTIKELLEADMPERIWLIEGMVLDESLIALAGRKKLGKSWMATQLAQAVATGGDFLGHKCTKGTVLLLALEDGERRLRDRLRAQRASADIPVIIKFEMEPLDKQEKGGLTQLKHWIEEHKPNLVIIDTLAKALSGKLDQNAAGPTADIVNALHSMSVLHHVVIILISHHGKMSHGDVGMDIRGSSAIPGATDGNFGLYRNGDDYYFKGESRDVEEFDLKVRLDKEKTWRWELLGESKRLAQQLAEQAILDALEVLTKADTDDIAKESGLSSSTVRARCKKMRQGVDAQLSFEKEKRKIVYWKKK